MPNPDQSLTKSSQKNALLPLHKCPECDYVSTHRDHVNRHLKQVHLKIRDVNCPHCDYATVNRDHLKRHIKRKHDKVRDIECPFCIDYQATTKDQLRAHVARKHPVKIEQEKKE